MKTNVRRPFQLVRYIRLQSRSNSTSKRSNISNKKLQRKTNKDSLPHSKSLLEPLKGTRKEKVLREVTSEVKQPLSINRSGPAVDTLPLWHSRESESKLPKNGSKMKQHDHQVTYKEVKTIIKKTVQAAVSKEGS